MKLDIQNFLTSKNARYLIIGLVALFSLLIIKECGSYLLFATPKANITEIKPTKPTTKPQNTAQSIFNNALFGVYIPANLNEGPIQKSVLNYTVVGILLSDKSHESQVLLKSANGEEKSYKVGDTITSGVKIERITDNGILVQHNGAIESLSLPKNDLTFDPVPKPLQEGKI